jgi:DNA polymerase-3 subunit alpha
MHERLEPILRETYGVMIYQEQVMMAARELAGFTMSEADILRSAMGKKDKPKMAKMRTKFIAGALERDIPESTANALYDSIAKFAEYGFNRAHSAAYGVIAYQTAYLKANYPLEYMTSLLINMEGNADRVATAIVDCRNRGIEVLTPDINASRADFSMVDGRILFGLAAIKNVGQHAVESIVALREADGPFKSLEDLCERATAIQDVNRRVLEALVQ